MEKQYFMKKDSYLCTMKPFRGMKMMKHVALLAVLAVPATGLMAQNQGVGVNFTPATFQVHSYTEVVDYLPPVPLPTGGGGNDINSGGITPIDDEHHYRTTLLITNSNTGLDTNDGLLIRQFDNDVVIRQNENGYLLLKNHAAQLKLTHLGRVGIGEVNNYVTFNVEGTSRFSQGVNMVSSLTVGGAVTMNGGLTVGSGFSCDASGNLKVNHLKVTLTDWPDYVFGGGHALMPLGELEAYIGEHQHLPGIPTAAEVEQEGADLGEMNRLLMEKVEELTLYIIDLQKQIDEMKSNQ